MQTCDDQKCHNGQNNEQSGQHGPKKVVVGQACPGIEIHRGAIELFIYGVSA
jgi:hypothetical protein